jgi:hypothetical protein
MMRHGQRHLGLVLALAIGLGVSVTLSVETGFATGAETSPEPPGGLTCSYDESQGIVDQFLDAYNNGDEAEAALFFGPKFRWLSANDRASGEAFFVTYEPGGATAYLRGRYARGEELLLREFHLSDPGGVPPRDLVNFWYRLDRMLDGHTFKVMGKGALDCDGREIFVWSMADCDDALLDSGGCVGGGTGP